MGFFYSLGEKTYQEELKDKDMIRETTVNMGKHNSNSEDEKTTADFVRFVTSKNSCVYCNGTGQVFDNDGVGWICKYCGKPEKTNYIDTRG